MVYAKGESTIVEGHAVRNGAVGVREIRIGNVLHENIVEEEDGARSS